MSETNEENTKEESDTETHKSVETKTVEGKNGARRRKNKKDNKS